MITLLLVAGAVAFLFWPRGSAAPAVPAASDLFRVPPQVTPLPAPAAPDPRPAIDRLLQVRDRLAETGRLDEANAKAVDQLVLELVHGKRDAK